MAAGALALLRRRHIAVPDTIALAGFDDSRIAATSDPPLTTMRQPLSDIAARVVDILVNVVYEGGEPTSATFPTEFVRRASA